MIVMLELKKIDVLSLAKLSGIIGAIVGFILGLIAALTEMIINSAMDVTAYGTSLSFNGLGFVLIIALPILYGIIGFVGGAITAFLYNIVTEKTGGVMLDVQQPKKRSRRKK